MHRLLFSLAIMAITPQSNSVEASPHRHPDPAADRAIMTERIRGAVVAAAPRFAQDPFFARALEAVATIPRERFVLPRGRAFAYLGAPQDIGWNQTISDPYVVTVMTAAARIQPGAHVLEVGTGSGYQAAVLSKLGAVVSTVEIVAPLAKRAEAVLHRLRYTNIAVKAGDGFAGWPDRAPFDAILVTAGAAEIPAPLLAQLKSGGRLVMPIGPSTAQEQLFVYTKASDGSVTRCRLGWTMFVPLTGRGERPPTLRGLADQTTPYCYGAPVT